MKSFTEAFNFIKALAGVNNFTTQEKANIKILLNRRLKTAYNSHEAWREYTVTGEERYLVPRTIEVSGVTDAATMKWAGMYNDTPFWADTNYDTQDLIPVTSILYKSNDTSKTPSNTDYNKPPGEWRYVHKAEFEGTENFITPWDGVITSVTERGEAITTSNLEWGNVAYTLPDLSKETFLPTLSSNTWSDTNIVVTGKDQDIIPYEEKLIGSPEATPSQPFQKPNVDTFQRIYKEYPYAKKSSVEYDFHVNYGGAEPLNLIDSPQSVYVTYKKVYEDFLFTDESQKVIFPNFFQYACYGTYADFLRFDGQLSKALVEEELAKGFLQTEMEKVDIMNNSNLNFRVQTHLSHQSR